MVLTVGNCSEKKSFYCEFSAGCYSVCEPEPPTTTTTTTTTTDAPVLTTEKFAFVNSFLLFDLMFYVVFYYCSKNYIQDET